MASLAELILKIQGKDQASGEINKVKGSLGGLSKSLGRMGEIAGGIAIAQQIKKIPAAFSSLTTAASDLGESVNAVTQIFDDQADKVLEWGRTNANAFGLSQRAFNQLATPLGAMLKNAGLSMDDVSDSTINLAKRAADMASVFNTSVEDALGAVQAGLRGETDPLERYGVSIRAVAVEQKALAMTGKSVAKELTEAEKAAARVALIMEQTADVEGDFANTSDQAANAARIQAAKMEELQATIGKKLLPIQLKITQAKLAFVKVMATKVLPAATKLGGFIREKLTPVFERLGDFVEVKLQPALKRLADDASKFATELREKLGPSLERIGKFIQEKVLPPLERFTNWFVGNRSAMQAAAFAIGTVLVIAFLALAVSAGAAAISVIIATAPILAIIAVIALLAAGIFLLIKHWDDLTAKYPFLQTMLDGLKTGFSAVSGFITGTLIPAISSLVSWFRVNVLPVLAIVAGFIVGTVVPALVSIGAWIVTNIIPRIWSLVTTFVSLHIRVGQIIGGIIAAFWPFVMLVFGAVRQIGGDLLRIGDKFAGFMGRVIGLVNPIINIIKTLIDWIGRIPTPGEIIGGIGGAIGSISPFAHGTMFAKGGLSLVGEHGPELVRMPRGSQVYTATQTAAMVRGGSFGGGGAVSGGSTTVRVELGGQHIADIILEGWVQLERTGRVRVVTT